MRNFKFKINLFITLTLAAVAAGIICFIVWSNMDVEFSSKVISTGKPMSKEHREESSSLDEGSYEELLGTFGRNNEINFSKRVLIIFGKNNCAYCEILKDEIMQDEGFKSLIKDNFNAYYINISYEKMHFLGSNNINTRALTGIYEVLATPTIIILDKEKKLQFRLVGFSPTIKDSIKDFITTGPKRSYPLQDEKLERTLNAFNSEII